MTTSNQTTEPRITSGVDESEVDALRRELDDIQAENARLRALLGLDREGRSNATNAWEPTLFTPDAPALLSVDRNSPVEEKIALFRSLFQGRDDVYALRWENLSTGRSGWAPAVRGGWANARKRGRKYLPFTDEIAEHHLAGEIHAGVYPLLHGDVSWLLACDFDGPGWALDALAYLDAARAAGVPVALERSRSGDGAHVWTFFSTPVPATPARRIGIHLLREAMAARAELDLGSYDRLFPAQDFMPKGSFGSLIALPLHGGCRQQGTTVFLDPATLEPFDDQWAFLSSLQRLSREAVVSLAEALRPVDAGPDGNPYRSPKGADAVKPPDIIRAELGSTLAIERSGIPPALLSALKHLASLHNPEFYERERLRLSTWRTPRFIRCYRETLDRLQLPRGLTERASSIIAEAGSKLDINDERPKPNPVRFNLTTTLTTQQQAAVESFAGHELGVVVAPPGSGKTVIACALVATRSQPTLVIVDRKPLLDQWRNRLSAHLGLDPKQVGQLGTKRVSGLVDLAMAQSLARRNDLHEITSPYGLVVIDECHHVPAVTFERCVRQIPVRQWLGLTATPYRRDGLQALITMHCGTIHHEIHPRDSDAAPLRRELVVHETEHLASEADELSIQDVFRGLVLDQRRTEQISRDVSSALEHGRNCLVLTQWTRHLEDIAEALRGQGYEPLILKGGLGRKARTAVTDALSENRADGGLLLVATGSYLGEGFDCPALDTLFLAFPLAFKGRIVQYVGRILRTNDNKDRVEVHDYVDVNVGVLARMHTKRLAAYASLGFDTPGDKRAERRQRKAY